MNLSQNCCFSGGANGADLEWGAEASRCGHEVTHFSFVSHRTHAPRDKVVMLTKKRLATADVHCASASRSLHRSFPTRSPYVNNLLRRNWFQVAEAQSCYGVGNFVSVPTNLTIPLGTVLKDMQITGGTAWAVAMFIERFAGRACQCFFFEQDICHWFRWQGEGWECIYHPPQPEALWAGIGTRRLNSMGKLAIHVLMEPEDKQR